MSEDEIIGFKVIDNDTLQVLDKTIDRIIPQIREFTNLRIKDGGIVGSNGVLSKYGVVGEETKVFVIISIIKSNEKLVGFCVCDNNGNIKKYKTSAVVDLYNMQRVANCRMNVNGLSPIKGTFPIVEYANLGKNRS